MNTLPDSPLAEEGRVYSRNFFSNAGKKGWEKVKSKRSPEYFRKIGKKGLAKRYADKQKKDEKDASQP